MTTLMEVLGNNATMSEIEQALDFACLLLPREYRDQCRQFVSDLVHTLESADKNLISDYTPQEFCSVIGLCQTYCCSSPSYPQEIHLSINNDGSVVYVMWFVFLFIFIILLISC